MVRRRACCLLLTAVALACCRPAALAAPPHSGTQREYLMLEFSEPAPGANEDFERWQEREHIPAVLKLDGFHSARRYEVVKADTPDSILPHQVTLYDVRAGDWDGVARGLGALPASGAAVRGDTAAVIAYGALGPTVLAADVPGSSPPTLVAGRRLQTYTMFVSTSPAPGMDREYNRWYDEQHVPDVLRIPGYQSARRYALVRVETPGVSMTPYLVLFTLQTYDLEATVAELKRRVRAGITRMTPAFGKGGHVYFMRALP
jgi:hypothetical protein